MGIQASPRPSKSQARARKHGDGDDTVEAQKIGAICNKYGSGVATLAEQRQWSKTVGTYGFTRKPVTPVKNQVRPIYMAREPDLLYHDTQHPDMLISI